MDNPLSARSTDELQSRLVEKYKLLSKENQDLVEKLNKTKVSSTAEINIEKEQHKKTVLELTKVHRENKDLRSKIKHLESQLQVKEHENKDLRSRVDAKGLLETKYHEKDMILFQKYVGRNPQETSTQDTKIQSIIRIFESQKERQEEEIKKLHRELQETTERLKKQEQERSVLRKEFGHAHEQISKEFMGKLEAFENENDRLMQENAELRNSLERLHHENMNLKEEVHEIKRKYDDLRSRSDDNAPLISQRATERERRSSTDWRPPKNDVMNHNDEKIFAGFRNTATSHRVETEENFHSFKPYAELTDLTLFECRKIISEVLELYHITTPSHIVPSIRKTEKVLQAIPRLQGLIVEISELLIPRTEGFTSPDQIDLIIPSLKKMCYELDSSKEARDLRANLIELFELKQDAGTIDVARKIGNLVNICRQFENSKSQNKSTDDQNENNILIEQLTKLLGSKPTLTLFKQLLRQFDDIKHFIMLVKGKLNLDENMSNEGCLTYLLKIVENKSNEGNYAEIVIKLKRMLNCTAEVLIERVEELMANQPDKRKTSSIMHFSKESFRK